MRWLLIGIGSLIVLVCAVWITGMLLPQDHTATMSAVFRESPGTVWDTITDFASAPNWRKEIMSVEQLPDRNGHPVWVETSRFGPLTLEITELDSARKLVTVIADPELPFGGSWTYELTPVVGGCKLTITERGEIYNPFFRFLARHVYGYYGSLSNYLTALGQHFGEEVVVSKL